MKEVALALCLCTLIQVQSFADTLPPLAQCDTIVTTYRKVIVAEIVSKNYKEIRFYECGDTTKALNIMPMSLVRRIKHPRQPSKWYLPESEWPPEWRQEEHRLEVLQGVGIGTIGLSWLSIFALFVNPGFLLLGLILAAVGVVIGITMLTSIRKAPYLRRMRVAAHAILWASVLPFLLVIFALVLLSIYGFA